MEQEIIEMLSQINPYEEVTETTLLLDEGILDSLALLLLISELEKKYAIQIPFEKLQLEDFQTVQTIVQFLKKKCDTRNL